MAWSDEARAAAAATRAAKAKHPAKGAKVAKAIQSNKKSLGSGLRSRDPFLSSSVGRGDVLPAQTKRLAAISAKAKANYSAFAKLSNSQKLAKAFPSLYKSKK